MNHKRLTCNHQSPNAAETRFKLKEIVVSKLPGSGGGLLQKLNRDTQRFAFKCSSVTVDGQDRDVFKRPVTDQGKQSKSGKLKLVLRNNRYETVPATAPDTDQLQEVFRNGELLIDHDFKAIRTRAMVQN